MLGKARNLWQKLTIETSRGRFIPLTINNHIERTTGHDWIKPGNTALRFPPCWTFFIQQLFYSLSRQIKNHTSRKFSLLHLLKHARKLIHLA